MTTSKKASPQENRGIGLLGKALLAIAVSISLLLCVSSIRKDWGDPVFILCILYTIAVFIFFIAQLLGFVLSQTTYSESVESPKFSLLEIEEEQWKNYGK